MDWQRYGELRRQHEVLKKERSDLTAVIQFVEQFRDEVRGKYGR
jgi:hypothetical protein